MRSEERGFEGDASYPAESGDPAKLKGGFSENKYICLIIIRPTAGPWGFQKEDVKYLIDFLRFCVLLQVSYVHREKWGCPYFRRPSSDCQRQPENNRYNNKFSG
mmetsp:Transcript_36860/g.60578  ORF Transcript_36860/g.60578 Transcript_36860/m.60578 type:complete len:104 (-) Transcript_36860:34-345(-)